MGEPESKEFGLRVAQRRQKLGMTQRDLARESGLSQREVSFIERGELKKPARVVDTLAKALRTSAESLLRKTAHPPR